MTGNPPPLSRSADESDGGLAIGGSDSRLSVPAATATIGLASLITWAVIWTAARLLFG